MLTDTQLSFSKLETSIRMLEGIL